MDYAKAAWLPRAGFPPPRRFRLASQAGSVWEGGLRGFLGSKKGENPLRNGFYRFA
jgi:hypothetical protein